MNRAPKVHLRTLRTTNVMSVVQHLQYINFCHFSPHAFGVGGANKFQTWVWQRSWGLAKLRCRASYVTLSHALTSAEHVPNRHHKSPSHTVHVCATSLRGPQQSSNGKNVTKTNALEEQLWQVTMVWCKYINMIYNAFYRHQCNGFINCTLSVSQKLFHSSGVLIRRSQSKQTCVPVLHSHIETLAVKFNNSFRQL